MKDKNKKPNYGIYIIVAGFLAILAVNLLTGSTKVNWGSSLTDAEKAAKSNNKPVMILFTTKTGDYATVCDRMDYATINKPDIAKYINHGFNPVKLEPADNKELVTKYSVNALPAIVLLLPGSDAHIRLDGFISEKEFVPRISNALKTLKDK